MTNRTLLACGAIIATLLVAIVALAPWPRSVQRSSVPGASAGTQTADIAERIVALLGDVGSNRSAASGSPRRSSPAEIVAGLREAMRNGDARAAAQFVDRWFREIEEPAQAVLNGIASNPEDPGDVSAFGVLLASAMVHARQQSTAVRPWTAESLAATALGLFPKGEGAARALRVGLEPSGSSLPGRLLGDLLRLQADDGVGALTVSVQSECMSLADAWARTMPPDAEIALLEVFAGDDVDAFAQGQAVKLLLRRDWRVFSETLLDLHIARQEAGVDFDEDGDVVYHLSSHAQKLAPQELAEYAAALFREKGAAAHLAMQLAPEQAAALLEQPGLAPPLAARRWLELNSGNGAWMEAGIELLGGDTGHPNLSWAPALATLVERGSSGEPAFEAALQRRFERRAQGKEMFWGALRSAAGKAADEATLLRTFVPLVEASVGESGSARSALVALLRERLPNNDLK